MEEAEFRFKDTREKKIDTEAEAERLSRIPHEKRAAEMEIMFPTKNGELIQLVNENWHEYTSRKMARSCIASGAVAKALARRDENLLRILRGNYALSRRRCRDQQYGTKKDRAEEAIEAMRLYQLYFDLTGEKLN